MTWNDAAPAKGSIETMSKETTPQPAQLQSIVIEYEFPHPPGKVWRALTESGLIASWLMPNDFRPEVGHRFTFRTRPAPGFDGIVHCEVLIVEPNRRLSYSWRGGSPERGGYGAELDTVVTWTLEPILGGTRLRLDHDGFTPDKEATFNILKQGWTSRVIPALGGVMDTMA
jgi:uncharacterized protein YndB with AHSA1/START domain